MREHVFSRVDRPNARGVHCLAGHVPVHETPTTEDYVEAVVAPVTATPGTTDLPPLSLVQGTPHPMGPAAGEVAPGEVSVDRPTRVERPCLRRLRRRGTVTQMAKPRLTLLRR
jgi:hypothetical protein